MQIESNFMRSMRSVATDCKSHKGWHRGEVVSSTRRKVAVLRRPLLVNTSIRLSSVLGVLEWLFCSLLSLFIAGWCLQSTAEDQAPVTWSLYRPPGCTHTSSPAWATRTHPTPRTSSPPTRTSPPGGGLWGGPADVPGRDVGGGREKTGVGVQLYSQPGPSLRSQSAGEIILRCPPPPPPPTRVLNQSRW